MHEQTKPYRARGVIAGGGVGAGDAHGEAGDGTDRGVVRVHLEPLVEGALLLAEAAGGVCGAACRQPSSRSDKVDSGSASQLERHSLSTGRQLADAGQGEHGTAVSRLL